MLRQQAVLLQCQNQQVEVLICGMERGQHNKTEIS